MTGLPGKAVLRVAALAALVWASIVQAGEMPAANTLVHATAAPVAVRAGAGATATVHLVVLGGWHVYSNPPTTEYTIPTQLSLAPAAGVRAGAPGYPKGRAFTLAGDDQPQSVYDGEFDVTLPLTAAANAVNGTHVLKGKVAYQACDDHMCLPPASVPFTLEVTVTGGVEPGAAPAVAGTPAAGAAEPETAAAVSSPDTAARGSGFVTGPPAGGAPVKSASQQRLEDALAKGWVWWLLALFVGGLLLNLTPCVFPMIGITLSIFGARKTETTPRAMVNAIAYVLGIMVTYTALGVVAALTGGLFGAALQNAWVNVGLGLLLVVLSLSMFGLYELQAPAWLLDRAGGANTGSVVGLFVSGLAVGIVAAPCVGPFVIGVLGLIAQRGSVAFGLQTMGTMSFGLGAPYLVLATFSNLLGGLPRAGDWMDWVKKFFGVLLAAIGLYYAGIGIAPAFAPWVLPGALVLGGLYLGAMEKSGNHMRRFLAMKRALGTLAVLGGVLLAVQLTTLHSRSIPFRPYDEAAVQASLTAGHAVMIDFGADWCAACHELEQNVFPDRDVIAAAKPFDAYKADLTHGDSPMSQRLGVTGLPTVVFLAPGGTELRAARVEGYLAPREFAARVRAAAEQVAKR